MKKLTKYALLLAALAMGFAFTSCQQDSGDDTTYYTVSFNSNGGTEVKSQKVESGKKATKPADPTKQAIATETYAFENWYTSTDGGATLSDTAFDFNTPITKDITLYAKWATNVVTHTVTFDSKNGSTAEIKTVNHGNKVERPTNPTKAATEAETYTFENWYTSTDNGTTLSDTAFDFNTPITKDITLYAKWATNVVTHTVTFDSKNGSTAEIKTVNHGNKVERPADPTKQATETETYTFDNWYTSTDGGTTLSESAFDFDTAIKGDITLYAKWAVNAVTPQKSAGSISYATTSVEKTTADEAFTNALNKTGDGTVTYASSETDVATVNASTGEVTIVGAGTATITATVADSDTYTYATKTASYMLIVKTPEGFVKVLGTTIKGDENWVPASKVFVSRRSLTIPDLYVCDHEVTRGEFKTLMGTDPSTADAYDKEGNKLTGEAVLNNPVNYVNWYAAIAYCNKLSVKEGLDCAYTVSGITDWENLAYSSIPTSMDDTWNAATCNFTANGYRLPTEAEWEWLARGGQNYTYAGSDTVDDVAWYKGNTNETGSRDVKTKTANVWEWCWDWYASKISSDAGASGASSGTTRVRRGGSWCDGDGSCKVAYRFNNGPNGRNNGYGFRLVRNAN